VSVGRDYMDEELVGLAEDFRFVVVVQGPFHDEWRSGAESGQDFWAHAEALVALKRAEKVDRKFRQISRVSHCSTGSRSRIRLR
jgi:hypothetical protein